MEESRSYEDILIECEKAIESFDMFRAYEILEDDLKSFKNTGRKLVCEGKVLASLNRIDEAINKFSECITDFREHREAYVERGYYRLRKGDALNGYLDLKQAMEIEELDDGKLSLAKAALVLGKYEEARDLYNALLKKISPRVVEGNFTAVNKYLIDELNEKAKVSKLTLNERISLGKSYMYIGELENALAAIGENYTEVNEYDDLIVVGWIFRGNDEDEICEGLLDKAIALEENKAKAYLFKGIYYQDGDDFKEAYKLMKKAIKVEEGYIGTYVKLAEVCLELGKFKEGLNYCDKSIELGFKEYAARYIKGCILNRLRRFKEALDEVEKALELYNGYGDYYAEKSYALRNLGYIREANEICEEALSYGFDTERINIEKGLILKSIEYYENAISWFDAAIDVNGESVLALFNKLICQIKMSNYKGALEGIELIKGLRVVDPLLWGAEFLIYYAMDDFEECKKVIEDYLKIAGNSEMGKRKKCSKNEVSTLIFMIDTVVSKLKVDNEYENIKEKLSEYMSKI